MIRMMVLGLIRAMLVTVWLLISVIVALLLIGAMILRVARVAPQDDDAVAAFAKLYNVLAYKIGKKDWNVPL